MVDADRTLGPAPRDQLSFGIAPHEVRVLHAADLHLDSPLRGLSRYPGAPVDELRNATRAAFDALVELAIADAVHVLLIAGDVFDGDWKDYNTGLYFVSRLQRLVDHGVRVVIARGNHDAGNRFTRQLRWPEGVVDLATDRPETRVFDELGLAVHGQGYAEAATVTDLAALYPLPLPGLVNVGLLHTALDGREGHQPYAPTTATKLAAKGYDYWALGHVHQREELSSAPWIVFPGNLQGRHARETGPKGATRLTLVDTRVVRVEPVVLDVVRWAHVVVDVSGARTVEDVLSRVESALFRAAAEAGDRLLAVRVRLTGVTAAQRMLVARGASFEEDVRALAVGVASGRVWIEKVQLHTRAALDRGVLVGPLAELAEALTALPGQPAELEALVPELSELVVRLGAKLADERGEVEDARALVQRLAPELASFVVPLLSEGE